MDLHTVLSVTTALLGLLLSLAVYYWFKISRTHYWRTKNVPSDSPFTFARLFTGKFNKKPFFESDVDALKKHGRIYGSYLGFSPILMVAEPEVLRKIFVKDFHVFADRRNFSAENPVARSFVSALAGEDWKRVRSVITPAFSTGKLKNLIYLMGECATLTTEHFLNAAKSEKPEECKRIFGAFTLDIIASTAFGTKIDTVSDPDNIFVDNVKKMLINEFPWKVFLIIIMPKLSRFLKFSPFREESLQFFSDMTNAVVQRRKQTGRVRGDFLDLMMEAQKNSAEENQKEEDDVQAAKDAADDENHSYFKQYSKNKRISADEFVAQCVLFFLAGYDTTATTLSMTVYNLALNPKCQEEVLKEVDAIWKKYPELDQAALMETKYLDAAINETLRLTPASTRTERRTLQDYPIEDTGITIPKDMFINVPIYAMHHNPEFFPDPEKYQPERFLPENKHLIQPYTYIPFGAGPRNCLGMRFALMEIKICLLHVLRAVTFERCSETKVPIEIYAGANLFQPKAITLKIKKRNV